VNNNLDAMIDPKYVISVNLRSKYYDDEISYPKTHNYWDQNIIMMKSHTLKHTIL